MTGKTASAPPWAGSGVLLTALVLVVCAAMPAHAGTAGAATRASSEEEARAMLARMHEAEVRTPYEGTRFVSARTATGATTIVVKIKHVPDRGTVVHLMGTTVPRAGIMYDRPAGSRVRGLTGETLRLLMRHYRLGVAGTESVAGRKAYEVEARRADGSLAACFWMDRRTGLMLRREIYDRSGRVVRKTAFIQLDTGGSPRVTRSARSSPRPWRHRLRPAELGALRAHGWQLPHTLPGGLSLVDARRGTAHGRKVVHLSYSDGLFMVSLFVQRGSLATRRLDDWRRTSLKGCCVIYRQHTIPRRVVWAGNDHVYTLVADAPPGVVRQVVTTLPHAEPSTTLLERMTRGFNQLGTWLNPFG